jgi:uncharacterized protein involved in exopolysaccharide biosynthesis
MTTNLQPTLLQLGERVADVHASVEQRVSEIRGVQHTMQEEQRRLLEQVASAFSTLNQNLERHIANLQAIMGTEA